jgi:hypothetical protein
MATLLKIRAINFPLLLIIMGSPLRLFYITWQCTSMRHEQGKH